MRVLGREMFFCVPDVLASNKSLYFARAQYWPENQSGSVCRSTIPERSSKATCRSYDGRHVKECSFHVLARKPENRGNLWIHTRKGGACASPHRINLTRSTKINYSNRNLITIQIRFWTVIIARQS
jgi:hypothetical protein